jgi:hypothetical protein
MLCPAVHARRCSGKTGLRGAAVRCRADAPHARRARGLPSVLARCAAPPTAAMFSRRFFRHVLSHRLGDPAVHRCRALRHTARNITYSSCVEDLGDLGASEGYGTRAHAPVLARHRRRPHAPCRFRSPGKVFHVAARWHCAALLHTHLLRRCRYTPS